jgi:tetratricopeptide (TPR) repeat protein
MNLQRRGGACPDAAWYAAQIGKALGVTAAACRAAGSSAGSPPAWVAFIKAGATPTWDLRSGRHDEHEFWPGEVTDPQTNQLLRDDELVILPALFNEPELNRFSAALLAKSADLFPVEKRLPLLTKAIELSPPTRAAWDALIDFVTHDKPSETQIRAAEELTRRHLLRRFPEFALAVRLRMAHTQNSVQQHAALKRTAEMFHDRRDLFAAARLADGDLFREEKRTNEALAAYGEALQADEHNGPNAVLVLSRVDPLLQRTQDLERLAAIYRQAFATAPRPRASAFGRTTPFYILGHGYEQILEQLNDTSTLTGVRAQLDGVMLPGAGQQP